MKIYSREVCELHTDRVISVLGHHLNRTVIPLFQALERCYQLQSLNISKCNKIPKTILGRCVREREKKINVVNRMYLTDYRYHCGTGTSHLCKNVYSQTRKSKYRYMPKELQIKNVPIRDCLRFNVI